jgi:hypothetical protein
MLDRAFGSSQSLTLQQFEAAALARFDARDVNHDGLVTATERHKGRDQLKTQRHAPGEQQQTPETAPPPPGQ